MEDKLKKFGELIDVINKQAETKGAIVTPKFGDNWMDHARTHFGQESILAIAWVQGRRALLLEYALKEQMTTYASQFRREVTDDTILPCGCSAHGDPVYWNPFNKVVQCHKCGHVYTSNVLKEVTDEEIDEHIYSVYSPKLDDDKDREFVYTVRACRGAMRSMAKWVRSKMNEE